MTGKHGPPEERFWRKVDKAGPVPAHRPDLGPCWVWLGGTVWGYGSFYNAGGTRRAHVWAYVHLIGPVPDGLELDHLCSNTRCVNPAHLEPVTHRVNTLRGTGPTARNALATHCAHGHPYDEANTLWVKQGRQCRTCNAEHNVSYRARNRERLLVQHRNYYATHREEHKARKARARESKP